MPFNRVQIATALARAACRESTPMDYVAVASSYNIPRGQGGGCRLSNSQQKHPSAEAPLYNPAFRVMNRRAHFYTYRPIERYETPGMVGPFECDDVINSAPHVNRNREPQAGCTALPCTAPRAQSILSV